MSRMKQDLLMSRLNDTTSSSADVANMLKRVISRGVKPRVCIIGAGVSGLRCADVLLEKGFDVTIFEARNRFGGRLWQSRLQEHLVDLGPNWIHGTDQNPILEIAKQTDTKLHEWGERMAMFDYKGRLLPFDESKEVSETFWSIVMEAFKYSHDHTASIPAHESLWSFFKKKVEDQFLDSPQEEARRKRQNLLKMSEMWGAFIGGTIQTQSLKFFWLEECIEGENPFCAETYHKILNYIAEPAIKRDIVRYSHKVVQITTSESLDAPKISVRIADGKSHDFDEVVVTTPLGWLKQNTSMFKPELPPRIVKAIASIGYGNLDKVYFTFPTAFWDTPNQSESNGGIEDHSTNPLRNAPNTTATTAPLHQFRSNANAASHFAGFMQWTSPHYAPSNPEHWNQEGMNLAALPPSCAHPTLLFYVFGPCALHISAIVRETQPSQLTKVLFDYFEPYISRLPNYKGDGTECQPLEALATAWANDELAGWGSYSNFPVGLEEGDKDIEVMREGVPERGIWLAGEHTAPFVALGTVTGAYWSGEGLAKRIARVYGMHGGDETKQTATTD